MPTVSSRLSDRTAFWGKALVGTAAGALLLVACSHSEPKGSSSPYAYAAPPPAGSPGAPSPHQDALGERRAARPQTADEAGGEAPLAAMEVEEEPGMLRRLAALGAEDEPAPEPTPDDGFEREAYDTVTDNAFIAVEDHPLSTFSIDVDTASYANTRRFLHMGTRPPPSAVRIEEMINYFKYDYPAPSGEHPFHVDVEVANAPWAPEHRLVRVGLKGKEIERGFRPRSNLVFLLDVSGSMSDANKLPLLKRGLGLLLEELNENDRVSIVVYAGASGLVLPPTRGDDRAAIERALDALEAGGSTNGGAGIELAYRVAREAFVPGGTNRVILATDGDFNVGTTSRGELVSLVQEQARSGVFLTVLGLGMGNFQDAMLEEISNKGNGNYAYLDSLAEARKVLVEDLTGTLVTIAKDVKIQIEFNPLRVASYRLIGYENRLLADEDFHDDKKDAGDIGAGHTVTALYEVVPRNVSDAGKPKVDPLKYQTGRSLSAAADSLELGTVKLRYKLPDSDTSTLLSVAMPDDERSAWNATGDFRFAAAVASFGMLLRDSPHKGSSTFAAVRELAASSGRSDAYREEFIELVAQAEGL